MTECPIYTSKSKTARGIMEAAAAHIRDNPDKKMNLIWLEATGCSGNIISLMNGEHPDLLQFAERIVSVTYQNSLMVPQGEAAFEAFLRTLDTDFILVVEGAVAKKERCTIVAYYKGNYITAAQAVKMAAEKAKYVVAVGTCACYGGISAAKPNPSESVSVDAFLEREVILAPGCPGHPDWIMGTIAHLAAFGKPQLDNKNRPLMFYGITIHDRCPRRSYFDSGIFASKLGEETCMFKLGCRGPVTRTDCPIRRWNNTINWPVGDNTPCIGCAREGFPDAMEPFVRY